MGHGCEILDKMFGLVTSNNTAVQYAAHHCYRVVAQYCQDQKDKMTLKIIGNIDKSVSKPVRQTYLKCLTVILDSPDFAS